MGADGRLQQGLAALFEAGMGMVFIPLHPDSIGHDIGGEYRSEPALVSERKTEERVPVRPRGQG